MVRSTASRRARNSASVRIGARRRPESRPSRRRWRLASRRVDPRTPRTPSPLSSSRFARPAVSHVDDGVGRIVLRSTCRLVACPPRRRRRRRRRRDAVDVPASAVIRRLGVLVGRALVAGRGLARRCAVRRLGASVLSSASRRPRPRRPRRRRRRAPVASSAAISRTSSGSLDHGLRRLEGRRRLLGRSDSCGVVHGTGLGCGLGRSPSTPRGGLRCVAGATNSDAGRDHRRGDGVDRVRGDVGGRAGRGRGRGLRRRDGFGGGLLRRTSPGRPGRRDLLALVSLSWFPRRRRLRLCARCAAVVSGPELRHSRRIPAPGWLTQATLSFGADSGASAVPAAFLARPRARGALTVGAGGA